MNNFGVYLNSIGDTELTNNICKEIDRAISEDVIKDASIFYDQIGHLEAKLPCGIFHSSDLWNFQGNLLVLSISSALRIKNIANGINMILGYGWGRKNVLATLKMLEDENIKTFCYSEDLAKDFYRISGKKPIGHSKDFKNSINIIMEQYNDK
tara:strand:- start:661 stop:1119 length:459 start_codon:yes stop_codon:yes gene_type:complete